MPFNSISVTISFSPEVFLTAQIPQTRNNLSFQAVFAFGLIILK